MLYFMPSRLKRITNPLMMKNTKTAIRPRFKGPSGETTAFLDWIEIWKYTTSIAASPRRQSIQISLLVLTGGDSVLLGSGCSFKFILLLTALAVWTKPVKLGVKSRDTILIKMFLACNGNLRINRRRVGGTMWQVSFALKMPMSDS